MVRFADENDTGELAALFKELHEHHVKINPKTFRMPDDNYFIDRITELMNEGLKFIVQYTDGINGYAAVKIIDVITEEKIPRRMCYVDCFAVSERARRRGIGTELFDRIKEYAREKNCDTVQLGVSALNSGAEQFYRQMGLTPRTIQMELYL